jgi:hypothetical protein
MSYQYLDENIVGKIDDDGVSRMSCSVENAEYQAWIAAGNTPDPADATPVMELKAKIKSIRAAALEWFTKNSGVATVYDLNYEASVLGAADTVTILRNNKTPAQHLTDFGQYLGMTGEQFGAYVLNENKGPTGASAGVKMSEIEAEYLRVCYALPNLNEADVIAYQAFCDARML